MLKNYFINPNSSIKKSFKQMKLHGLKSLYIVDNNKRLLGSVSEGDLRLALLRNKKIENKINDFINYDPKYVIKSHQISDAKQIKKLFKRYKIDSLPILDETKKVLNILPWFQFYNVKKKKKKLKKINKYNYKVLIMAGGEGTRLKPFTNILPKPLVPLKNRTVIEHIISYFEKFGASDFLISTNYKSEIIKFYLKNKFKNIKIKYLVEQKALGTVGSISMIKTNSPILVSNCDVLHLFNLEKFCSFHYRNKNDISLVVTKKKYTIPYGVCDIDKNQELKKINEKPVFYFYVNTGFYIIDKNVKKIIPKNKIFNFNELIDESIKLKLKIGTYKISNKEWYDIGRWDELSATIKKFS